MKLSRVIEIDELALKLEDVITSRRPYHNRNVLFIKI